MKSSLVMSGFGYVGSGRGRAMRSLGMVRVRQGQAAFGEGTVLCRSVRATCSGALVTPCFVRAVLQGMGNVLGGKAMVGRFMRRTVEVVCCLVQPGEGNGK